MAPFAHPTPLAAAALACALLAPACAAAQDVSVRGARLAAEICAPCHDIAARAQEAPLSKAPLSKARGAAPSFRVIARAEGVNERALAVFLRTPHATMPDIVLAPEEIEALAAYIMSRR